MNGILITVRMSSSRLPNKALFKLGDDTILEYQIKSLQRCKTIDKIIVCTSTQVYDDVIVETINKLKLPNVFVFRGCIKDKLNRMYQAAKLYNIKNIFYTGADNPFVDVSLIDEMMNQLVSRKLDFIDGERLDVPIGSIVQAFTFESIEKCCQIKNTDDTEMHTIYFKDSGLFKYGLFDTTNIDSKLKISDLRLTMDYEEDYQMFLEIYKRKKNDFLDLDEIIDIINKNPEIKQINYFRNIDWNNKQKETEKMIIKQN